MKYWWVNHKQTYFQEVNGGYLWSPKFKKDKKFNKFYDNMRHVDEGDIIFSYANGKISDFGICIGSAISAAIPKEFGQIETNWNQDGWLLPVTFTLVEHPIKPKDYIDVIEPLLPTIYSPLQKNGNGNQGAYLAAISESLAIKLIELLKLDSFLESLINSENNDPIDKLTLGLAFDRETEKISLVKTRLAQTIFRKNLRKIETKCRLTNTNKFKHLIASHIKPWSLSNNKEKIDGNNGLWLTPNFDHLFDKGYISFTDNGVILISPNLDREIIESWNLDRQRNIGKFSPKQTQYLAFHQKHIFQS